MDNINNNYIDENQMNNQYLNINSRISNELNEKINILLNEAYYEEIKLKLINNKDIVKKMKEDEELKRVIDSIQPAQQLLNIKQYGFTFFKEPSETHGIFEMLNNHIKKVEYFDESFNFKYGNNNSEKWYQDVFTGLIKEYIKKHKQFIQNLVETVKKFEFENDIFECLPIIIKEDLKHYEIKSLKDASEISSYNRDVHKFIGNSENNYGTTQVVGSEINGIFYKIDNESHLLSPMKEYAVSEFYRNLFSSYCVPPSQLLFIKNFPIVSQDSKSLISKNNNHRPVDELINEIPMVRTILESNLSKEDYFIKASTHVKGEIIYKFLEEHKGKSEKDFEVQCLNKFRDIDNISSHILVSLLLVPTNFKYEFLMVEDETGRIISIENDGSFENEIKKDIEKKNFWQLGTRNVLYTITPFMKRTVSQKVSNEFLKVQPNLFLLNWLLSLKKKEDNLFKMIELSLPEGTNKESKIFQNIKDHLHLPQLFNKGFIELLLKKFNLIRKQLINPNKQTTHQQLFEIIHPLASKLYKLISKKFPNDLLEQNLYIFKKNNLKDLLENDKEIKEVQLYIDSTNEPIQQSISKTIDELINLTIDKDFVSYPNENRQKWDELISKYRNENNN